MTMTIDQITANRQKFIGYLDTNPQGFYRIELSLTDGYCGRCAEGMALDCFGLEYDEFGSYSDIEDILGLSDEDEAFIWDCNDLEEMTFSQIAQALRERWFPYEGS